MSQFSCASNPLHVLGAVISVKLTHGETVVGEVFCYETYGSNTLVLKEQVDADHASFRIVKIPSICEVTALSPPPPGASLDVNFPPCTKNQLEERERLAVSQFLAKRHTFGVSVTQDAQDIFDFIHKTHPDCCWIEGGRIQVMGVTVSSPYTPENCEGKGKALERIQQVLERFDQRRKTKAKPATPQPTAGSMPVQYWPCAGQAIVPQFYPMHHGTAALGFPSQLARGIVGAPQPLSVAPGTFVGGDGALNGSQTMGTAYGAPGNQPVMFFNSACGGVPTAVGDPNNLFMMQQGGNGLFFCVVHNQDDRTVAGSHSVLPAGAPAAIPGHPDCSFYTPVVFANPNGGNPLLTAATMPGGQPGVVSMAASDGTGVPGTGTPVFLPFASPALQVPQSNNPLIASSDPSRFAAPGTVNASASGAPLPHRGNTFKTSVSGTLYDGMRTEHGSAASCTSSVPPPAPLPHRGAGTVAPGDVDPNNHTTSMSAVPHSPPLPVALRTAESSTKMSSNTSAVGSSSGPDTRPAAAAYQHNASTLPQPGISTSSNVPSPPRSSTSQCATNYSQQQYKSFPAPNAQTTRSGNLVTNSSSSAPSDKSMLCATAPVSPQLTQQPSPVPLLQGLPPNTGAYNNVQQPSMVHHQCHHHHQHYHRVGSNGNSSMQETGQGTTNAPPNRPRWTSSVLPNNQTSSGLGGSTTTAGTKGQQQPYRQNTAYGLQDPGSRVASSNDADAPPVATTGLSSGSTSTGPNGGGHNNNYRGMNGGKGNRSQRNRGGGRKRD